MSKYLFLITIAMYPFIHSLGQSKKTNSSSTNSNEVKLYYSDGLEIFNVCNTNPNIKYYDSISYTWYTEFSKIKSTNGGTGGLLLNGNYKFFDKSGNLRVERNYFNGRLHGSEKYWDSAGNITSIYKNTMGKCVYSKFKNDEGDLWIEFIGPIFEEGTVRKIYTEYNRITEIDTQYNLFTKSVTLFYDNSIFRKSYFQVINGDVLNGIYKSFYENGKIKEKGQYWDSAFSVEIKVGTWISYGIGGTEIFTTYKRGVEYWENGEIKAEGTLVFHHVNKEWIKIGTWQFFKFDGKIHYRGEYIDGVFYEITE